MQSIMPRMPLCLLAVVTAASSNLPTLAEQVGADAGQTLAGAVDPRGLEVLSVRTPSGVARFYVQEPDAPASAAWRDDAQRADKAGNIPEPTPGFELTSRIVVRSDNPEALDAFASGAPGLVVEPLAAVSGYWMVTAGSVREATRVADVLAAQPQLAEVYLDLTPPRSLRDLPNDPSFPQQWHLKNDLDPLFDVNAEAAWDAGYTGAGVVLGIVEGGWQHDHPDLADNYHAAASQGGGSVTSHATSCAGVAAEVANNDLMGASVAYGAGLSDLIYGTAAETAAALAYRNDLNDIKSNSWGPPDIGRIYYMPSVVRSAIEESVLSGRGGLGEVFVWAAGNGGTSDRVDYDPYVASRFTIAVGAIGDADVRATYNETGSSMLVVAHSSGNTRRIHTTTSFSGWTTSFGGTSAASPLAGGVVALMLEANPGLTWRDVQHVLIESARKNDSDHADWTTNAGGYEINYNYGFGAVDAGAAVGVAETWLNVPHELVVDTGVVAVNTPIPDNDPTGVTETASIAENIRIETGELILNVQTTFVGDLEIALTGPSGTESVLAQQRGGDGQDDYVDYIFTSFRHWGEESAGDWTIDVSDRAGGDLATWIDYRLILYGTPVCPGDLNGDGAIGLTDLAALLTAYGTCEGHASFDPAADFDNTGCIDLADLAYLLSLYGESCS
ncbi:MAG: S8 family serine peptidase [Phycisphaerae bacterium]